MAYGKGAIDELRRSRVLSVDGFEDVLDPAFEASEAKGGEKLSELAALLGAPPSPDVPAQIAPQASERLTSPADGERRVSRSARLSESEAERDARMRSRRESKGRPSIDVLLTKQNTAL